MQPKMGSLLNENKSLQILPNSFTEQTEKKTLARPKLYTKEFVNQQSQFMKLPGSNVSGSPQSNQSTSRELKRTYKRLPNKNDRKSRAIQQELEISEIRSRVLNLVEEQQRLKNEESAYKHQVSGAYGDTSNCRSVLRDTRDSSFNNMLTGDRRPTS